MWFDIFGSDDLDRIRDNFNKFRDMTDSQLLAWYHRHYDCYSTDLWRCWYEITARGLKVSWGTSSRYSIDEAVKNDTIRLDNNKHQREENQE